MRMIIDGSLTPLNLSTTLRASRRCETTARGDDDYSLRKMQNVHVDSTAVSGRRSKAARGTAVGTGEQNTRDMLKGCPEPGTAAGCAPISVSKACAGGSCRRETSLR